MGKSKVFFSEESIDYSTGELRSKRWLKRGEMDGDKFFKAYVNDIGVLKKCTPNEIGVLIECFQYVDYNTNEVILNSKRRLDMSIALECSKNTINVSISRLMTKGLLLKTDGTLTLNPKFFFYGDDINRSKVLELVIQYNIVEKVDLSKIGKEINGI